MYSYPTPFYSNTNTLLKIVPTSIPSSERTAFAKLVLILYFKYSEYLFKVY